MHMNRFEMSGKEHWYALMNLRFPCLSAELRESVDEAAMRKALAGAIAHHPLFGMKPVFENGLFYFERNAKPPIVFRADDAPKTYGNAETNDYPWILTTEGRRLTFYAPHFLTDGMGMLSFCKTVLHLYFQHRGVVFDDSTTDFPDSTPQQTLENAYQKYADPDNRMLGLPRFDPPAPVDARYLQPKGNPPQRVIIPTQEIRKYAKDSETSVFAVIACILARAMARAYHIETGNINVRVPVNLRGIFPSATDRNFVQGFPLCYLSERMRDLPDAKVETAFRSQLDLYMEKSNLVQSLNEDVETVTRLKQGQDELRSILDWSPSPLARADIVYTHITRPGFSEELLRRISDLEVASDLFSKDTVFVYGITVGTEIRLTVQQCSENDCFMKALCNVLDARKLPYRLTPSVLTAQRTYQDTAVLRGASAGGNDAR